ncbi:hypothetical protein N7466_000189 [Penicillium verhagenii]|uniref:uncharacterized protein n=1 Tax=Penicillium verhagenii TaxID=1562060 RepID=UPI00254564DD|nr:uncharacterized protein N7466_000189 [Penicillium verhagenii]KAJ5947174.1 hypothetical protein N7466_000189 [Penicillium verhagenii]
MITGTTYQHNHRTIDEPAADERTRKPSSFGLVQVFSEQASPSLGCQDKFIEDADQDNQDDPPQQLTDLHGLDPSV